MTGGKCDWRQADLPRGPLSEPGLRRTNVPAHDRAAGPADSVLILHGWQNHRPGGHWQHLLADDLLSDGLQVRYPQLPDPDTPDWARWRGAVAGRIGGTRRAAVGSVIAHSLAAWVVLSLLAEPSLLVGMRVLLVAPVARETLAANPPIAAFDRVAGRRDPAGR